MIAFKNKNRRVKIIGRETGHVECMWLKIWSNRSGLCARHTYVFLFLSLVLLLFCIFSLTILLLDIVIRQIMYVSYHIREGINTPGFDP